MTADQWANEAWVNYKDRYIAGLWLAEQCERLEKDCACKDQEIAALKADLAECIASYSLHNP